jgi:hypothetical protein
MKRISLVFTVFLCLLSPASVFALPMYVGIEGVQSTIYNGINGYSNHIKMVLLIDSTRQGTCQTPDGQTNELNDYWTGGESGPVLVDYLYADLISFSASCHLSDWFCEYGLNLVYVDQEAENYAVTNSGGMFNNGSTLCINIPGYFRLYMSGETKNLWTDNLRAGMWAGWTGITMYDPSVDAFKTIHANSLYITSVAPVPEPITIVLLGIGFTAVSIFRRKHP